MPKDSGTAGFTIVEMLVAMLLLALVGLTLVRFQTLQLAGTSQLATTSLARLEADNRAVAFAATIDAPAGPMRGTSDNGGLRFHWTATPAPAAGDSPLLQDMVRIDISVALSENGAPVATRSLVRPRRLSPDGSL